MVAHPITVRPPPGDGSRRVIPRVLSTASRDRLRDLLDEPSSWVLRPDWAHYLDDGDQRLIIDVTRLSRDHRIAVLAWLRQQRHALHRAVEGPRIAPAGWLEATPLYRRLLESIESEGDLRSV